MIWNRIVPILFALNALAMAFSVVDKSDFLILGVVLGIAVALTIQGMIDELFFRSLLRLAKEQEKRVDVEEQYWKQVLKKGRKD
jgi:hypothetical protein